MAISTTLFLLMCIEGFEISTTFGYSLKGTSNEK